MVSTFDKSVLSKGQVSHGGEALSPHSGQVIEVVIAESGMYDAIRLSGNVFPLTKEMYLEKGSVVSLVKDTSGSFSPRTIKRKAQSTGEEILLERIKEFIHKEFFTEEISSTELTDKQSSSQYINSKFSSALDSSKLPELPGVEVVQEVLKKYIVSQTNSLPSPELEAKFMIESLPIMILNSFESLNSQSQVEDLYNKIFERLLKNVSSPEEFKTIESFYQSKRLDESISEDVYNRLKSSLLNDTPESIKILKELSTAIVSPTQLSLEEGKILSLLFSSLKEDKNKNLVSVFLQELKTTLLDFASSEEKDAIDMFFSESRLVGNMPAVTINNLRQMFHQSSITNDLVRSLRHVLKEQSERKQVTRDSIFSLIVDKLGSVDGLREVKSDSDVLFILPLPIQKNRSSKLVTKTSRHEKQKKAKSAGESDNKDTIRFELNLPHLGFVGGRLKVSTSHINLELYCHTQRATHFISTLKDYLKISFEEQIGTKLTLTIQHREMKTLQPKPSLL